MADMPPVLPPASAPILAEVVTTTKPDAEAESACGTESRDSDIVAALLKTFKDNVQVVQDKLKSNLGSVGKRNRKKKKEFYKLAEAEEEALKQTLEKELEPLGVNIADILPTSSGKEDAPEVPKAAESIKKKKSKALRRREKRIAEEKLRAQQIKEATERAASVESAKDREIRLLTEKIAPYKHRIHEVSADGHCLFRAIAHFLMDENNGKVPVTYEHLRHRAAAHMRRCSGNFSPFFSVDSLPAGLDAKPKNFSEYVDTLESTAMWGGEMELRALSNEFERPIELLDRYPGVYVELARRHLDQVFKADSANLQMCGDKFARAKPIRISFHRHYYALGEHYNSVVPC